jgi:hypothetical protein
VTCYYAHCMAIYGTQQEERDLNLLKALGFEVVNPNTPETKDLCDVTQMRGGNVMEEVFRPMVRAAGVVAFRGLPDGTIPSGVALELDYAREYTTPIIELPSGLARRRITLEQTREYLREVGQR